MSQPSELHCFLCGNIIQESDECCIKCGWTWSGVHQHADKHTTHNIADIEPFDDTQFAQRFGFSMQSVRSKGINESLLEFAKYIDGFLHENGLKDEGERGFALMHFLVRKKYAAGLEIHSIYDAIFGDSNERRRRRRDPYWNS